MLKRNRRGNCLRAIVKAGACAALWLAVAWPVHAQTPPQNPPATFSGPLRDPWVPPELRKSPATAPAHGADLRAQVERRLKADFDAAAGSAGTLTRAQATAAGLGLIARHFDEIDQGNIGTVRFADVKRFLKSRGAQFD